MPPAASRRTALPVLSGRCKQSLKEFNTTPFVPSPFDSVERWANIRSNMQEVGNGRNLLAASERAGQTGGGMVDMMVMWVVVVVLAGMRVLMLRGSRVLMFMTAKRTSKLPALITNSSTNYQANICTEFELLFRSQSDSRTECVIQGRSQDLVSGGPHPFRGGRPPIFRLRPQITRVSPFVLLATPRFRGGAPPPAPPLATPLV